jgi:hypothetical protein
MKHDQHAHDLPHLPLWRPYGTVYTGPSHLPEPARDRHPGC